MEALEREEKQLAEKLQAVCTPYGDERESKLTESSEILFSIGRLYVKKAEATDGMDQKLNYIKAATLLYGARARLDKFVRDQKSSVAVSGYISLMEKSLLEGCKGSNCDLMEISNTVARRLEVLREIEKFEVQKLEIIPDDIPDEQARKKQVEKINHVQFILGENTANFKHLMSYVAEKCLQILGNPPCHFAIVGLGSLSRGEITLYSDFEHVIILDEGVQDLPEYTAVQEYFRWLALLFQVIIIGLGETMIPSVGVRSLNDLRYNDKFRNWFFDAYTPSGVCIDGMMPHACKTPIGRQEPTAKKSHIVELIQPVSKMTLYVSLDEDLKNGYHLQDMLQRACFVFGSQTVFNYFKIQRECTLRSQNAQRVVKQISKLAEENVNEPIQGYIYSAHGMDGLNPKSQLYRPISALLDYLSRLSDITSTDTTPKFSQKLPAQHKITWARAVACEIRMKIYSIDGGSRGRIISGRISDFIGNSCVTNCIAVIEELSTCLRMYYDKSAMYKTSNVLEEPGVFDGTSSALLVLGHFQKAKKVLLKEQKYLSIYPWSERPGHVLEPLASIYFQEAKNAESEEAKRALYNKAKEIILSFDGHEEHRGTAANLYEIYTYEGRHSDALKTIERYLEVSQKSDFITRQNQVDAALKSMVPQEAIEYFEKNLSKHDDETSQLTFRFGIAVSRIKFDKEKGRKDFCKLVDRAIKQGTKVISKSRILGFLNDIFFYQRNNGCCEDTFVTLREARIIHESKVQYVSLEEVAPKFVDATAIRHYLRLVQIEKEFSKQLEMVDEVVGICKMSKNVAFRDEMLTFAILCLYENLDTKDFSIELFSKFYHEGSSLLHNQFDVFATMVFGVRGTLLHQYTTPNSFYRNFAKASTMMIIMLEKFSFILVHSQVVWLVYRVFQFIVSGLASLMVYPNGDNLWLKNKHVWHRYIPHDLYGCTGVLCDLIFEYKMNSFGIHVKCCWTLLHLKVGSALTKKAIFHLIKLISASLYFPIWQKLNAFFVGYISSHTLRLGSDHAMSEFISFESKSKCARSFWRNIMSKRSSAKLVRHSIIMLNHVVIRANNNRYKLVIHKEYLTFG